MFFTIQLYINSNRAMCEFNFFLICCQALELMNNWASEPSAHQARWLPALQSPCRTLEVRRCQELRLGRHNVMLCDPVKDTAQFCRESDWTQIDSIVIHFSFTVQVIALLFFYSFNLIVTFPPFPSCCPHFRKLQPISTIYYYDGPSARAHQLLII